MTDAPEAMTIGEIRAMGRPLVGSVLVGLALALITLVVILIINMPKKP